MEGQRQIQFPHKAVQPPSPRGAAKTRPIRVTGLPVCRGLRVKLYPTRVGPEPPEVVRPVSSPPPPRGDVHRQPAPSLAPGPAGPAAAVSRGEPRPVGQSPPRRPPAGEPEAKPAVPAGADGGSARTGRDPRGGQRLLRAGGRGRGGPAASRRCQETATAPPPPPPFPLLSSPLPSPEPARPARTCRAACAGVTWARA